MYYCIDCPFWEELNITWHLGYCPFYECTFDPDEGACEYGTLYIVCQDMESAQ